MVPRERRLRAYEKVNVLTVIKAFDASRSSMQHQAKSFNAIDSSFQGLELLTTGIVVVSREREREGKGGRDERKGKGEPDSLVQAGSLRSAFRSTLPQWGNPKYQSIKVEVHVPRVKM
jgi:hypothetical protein